MLWVLRRDCSRAVIAVSSELKTMARRRQSTTRSSVAIQCIWLLLHTFSYKVTTVVQDCSASSTKSNITETSIEDEEDEILSKLTLEEFKERYRRLIPYMTFYVANNYINTQTSTAQNNVQEIISSPLIRKNQQFPITRLNNIPRRGGNKHHIILQSQEKKFIPSVQYDPNNIGGENDYFTPMRYNSKVSYEDHPPPYRVYQNHKATYTEVTTISNDVTQKENRYFANVRPLRVFTTNTREHIPRKQLVKPIHAGVQEDYVLDYNSRVNSNPTINYPIKDFQGIRYIQSAGYPNVQQPIKILEPIPARQPPTIAQIHRNPNVNLNQIAESFQLSERLPEMLNKDNIDNSLKTLVEILNILHNSKKEEFPQIQAPQLIPSAPSLFKFPQKSTNYDNFKLRPPTRPKVITETRFQATPNPLFLTDDPERFKVATHGNDVKSNIPIQPNYNINNANVNNNKVVEYYTPVVQNIPENKKEIFLPTIKPQVDSATTEHSYEITEDLQDDTIEDNRYTSPITTENSVHSYTESPNNSRLKPTVPKTSLKYGATRGKPNVDYPAYATIPETDFSCKEQRYKGFFGDPATGCQVWHYCDLNGGKASFLCPNGTIFSQVALTCDWWFNVKCETTTQLYVLNERLYKYILPIMPKFPEDFTGPEVDRYLELKFKEMEAKLKEKKLKKQQEEKEKLKSKQQPLNENE